MNHEGRELHSQVLNWPYCKKAYNKVIAQRGDHDLPRSPSSPLKHYANMSVQYIAIFDPCKNGNFQMKKCVIFCLKHRSWVRRF